MVASARSSKRRVAAILIAMMCANIDDPTEFLICCAMAVALDP
jgi:hypothetical protein